MRAVLRLSSPAWKCLTAATLLLSNVAPTFALNRSRPRSPIPHAGTTSLAIDFRGTAHIAYESAGGIQYAAKRGHSWRIEIVASQGSAPSLAVGPQDQADGDFPLGQIEETLTRADRDRPGPNGPDADGPEQAQAVDSPSIAFQSAGGIDYATQHGHSWRIETVASQAIAPSLGIDFEGGAHIGYLTSGFQDPDDTMMVLYTNRAGSDRHGQGTVQGMPAGYVQQDPSNTLSKGWSAEVIDRDAHFYSLDLAVDPHGRPAVAYAFAYYLGGINEGIRYIHRTGSPWSTELDYRFPFPDEVSLAFDKNGAPHIAFTYDEVLEYIVLTASGWRGYAWTEDEPSDVTLEDDVFGVSLALGTQGSPHIAYRWRGLLKYAHLEEGSWITEVVDSTGGWGECIAVDQKGAPHISYANGLSGDLRYATRIGLGSWAIETVRSDRSKIPVDNAAGMADVEIRSNRWEQPIVFPVGGRFPLDISGLVGAGPSVGLETGHVRGNKMESSREGKLTAARGNNGEAAANYPATVAFTPIRPNPCFIAAQLRFSLAHRAYVSLEIFDSQGRRVRLLARGLREAGWHQVVWSGENDSDQRVGQGLYFARLRAGDRELTQRLVWLR